MKVLFEFPTLDTHFWAFGLQICFQQMKPSLPLHRPMLVSSQQRFNGYHRLRTKKLNLREKERKASVVDRQPHLATAEPKSTKGPNPK